MSVVVWANSDSWYLAMTTSFQNLTLGALGVDTGEIYFTIDSVCRAMLKCHSGLLICLCMLNLVKTYFKDGHCGACL